MLNQIISGSTKIKMQFINFLRQKKSLENNSMTIEHIESGTSFPVKIGILTFTKSTNFESINPGAGFQFDYATENNDKVSIYAYTLGENAINSIEHPSFVHARILSIYELHKNANEHGKAALQIHSDIIAIPKKNGSIEIAHDIFLIQNDRSEPTYSEIINWVAKNHFFKIRLTLNERTPEVSTPFRESLLEIVHISTR